jgi:hypothetical protein
METVIAIPIFLVVIGGTLWLGDLSFNRNQSLIADRYVAWNKGNRQGGTSGSEFDVQTALFKDLTETDVKDVKVKSKVTGWYNEIEATVKTKVKMPDWTKGMFTAGTSWDVRRVDDEKVVTGRDGPHLIVMRGGARDESMEDVNWIEVRTDNWYPSIGGKLGGGGGGMGGNFTKAEEYKRFGKFENWSD